MPALNAESPIPLYRQLADTLEARIHEGTYPPGARIPSEPELARRYGIGRPTVRQATDLLVRRRRLERRRGAGTFVIEPPEEVDLLSLGGTLASLETLEKSGRAVKTSLLRRPRRETVGEGGPEPFRGRTAWTLARLSRVDEVPVLLEELWLDAELFAGLGRLSLAGRSLSQIARDHYHLEAERAEQGFRVERVRGAVARALELPDGEPVLAVGRRVHFPHARDGVHARLFCRTDRFAFSQTLGGASLG